MKHDMVAKTLYEKNKKTKQKQKHPEIEAPKEINEQEYIQKIGDNE